MEIITDNIGIIILGVVLVALVCFFVKAAKKEREYRCRLLQELEQPYVEPQFFEYKSTVVEKYYKRKNVGGVKIPNTQECCCAVFKTQDGRLWEGEVSLEEFSQLQENQSVVIAVQDDKFYGFYIE